MERVGVRELRQHASRYLDRVKAGETVEVTERGELVAILSPPTASQSARDRLIASGRLLPASRSLPLPRPHPLPPGSPSTSEVLDELREDVR